MKNIIIMVGLPGSGKSTLRKNLLKNMSSDVFVYSTDDYVEDMARMQDSTYSEVFSQYIREATQHLDSEVKNALENGVDVLWDQTNLNTKKRKSIISKVPKGYKKLCYCIVPPRDVDEESELWLRLENRIGKEIPSHIIRNMWNGFQIPIIEEGYDELNFVDIYGEKIIE